MAVVGLCGAHNLLQRLVALIEKGGVDLSTVQHLIIDEADRLFDDGYVLSLPNRTCHTHSLIASRIVTVSLSNLMPLYVPLVPCPLFFLDI
jgi:hypothetical protein